MTDLLKLADRVEASRSTLEELVKVFPQIIEYDGGYADILNSLDAAKALHDAVLPGHHWVVSENNAAVMLLDGSGIQGSGIGDSGAAAWVAAILRAKAQEDLR